MSYVCDLDGEVVEFKRIDLTAWHVVELPVATRDYLTANVDQQCSWLKERDINHRWGNFSVEGDVGHRMVFRFFFPPEQVRDAMLFKLTWGGG